ncbi:MAG: hypothetical protein PHC69_08340 [Ruminiclostridium sp.]|nr:hypothetical protein [Ruminiclostridium sp.]
MNEIIINKDPLPREKEEYINGRPWKNLIADDFQKELGKFVRNDLRKKDLKRFPLCSEVSIFVDFYTRRAELTTIGVLKNTLDAMNRVLYSDDKMIKTVLVRRHIVNGVEREMIKISIMDAQPIISIDDTAQSYNNILYSMETETFLVDSYLMMPSDGMVGEAAQVNNYYDDKMSENIRSKYKGRPLEGNVKMAVEFNCIGNNGDIDNMFLSFGVPASSGIIMNKLSQIDTLLLRKNISRKCIPSIKVTWE